MVENIHHEHLVKELTKQLEPIFINSPQGVYLYLDDTHKTCNKKFSDLLGYSSPQEWIENEYPVSDVLEEDRLKGIQAYVDASQKFKTTTLVATWIKKDGEKVKTEVTLIPLTYQGEVFVLHFVSIFNP